jgi:hypothetical protein
MRDLAASLNSALLDLPLHAGDELSLANARIATW